MAKDPAILFYYQDFMYGTRRFTREQRGLYIELICEQADSKTGSIAFDDFEDMCNCDYADKVKVKFMKDENGYYNSKLRDLINKRRKFTESRRQNLESKKDSHIDTHKDNHKEPLMENEDEIENRNRNIPTLDQVKEFIRNSNYDVDAKLIFDYYDELNWHDSKGNPVKNWKNKIRTVWFKPERKKPHRPY